MYESKLHMYIEILCVLVSHGPLNLTQITEKVEIDKPMLMQVVSFLYDRCLVGEQNLDEDKKAYFVTARGLSVLKVVAPLISEVLKIQKRNFEETASALSEVNSQIMKKKTE